MKNLKLEKIVKKYTEIKFNEDNYEIGGGLDSVKFASRRHEDAKYDAGKLTEGKATQLFKTATGLDTDYVKAILNYAVPNMEWHHAGKLPKSYGGGMKKTYFLNATEIADLAMNWDSYCEKYEISLQQKRIALENQKSLEERKEIFLQENAKKITRVENPPIWFYETNKEMNGKFGWFSSYGKHYNMTEYYTGWEFKTEEKYHEFFNIK